MILKVDCKPGQYCSEFPIKKLLRVMKLITFILLTTLLQVAAKGSAQTVTLSAKNATLQSVFREVIRQTGVSIMYDEAMLEGAKTISLKVKDASVTDVLSKCLADQPFIYNLEGKTIVIKKKALPETFQLTPATIFMNLILPIDIRGKITNENGDPVLATIIVKGTKLAAVTNEDGSFVLNGINENATLIISGVGFQTREIKVKGNTDFNITVIAEIKSLDEVIINKGYYSTTQKLNTGSVSKVGAETIEKQPVTNFLAALQGSMSGVNIKQTTGVAGGGFDIEIRGRNSLRTEGNSPLYIIDGIPYATQNMYMLSMITIVGGPSALNGINPSDIETIEVLKDADATAIYGSRGANGVVLITTKKGKSGKMKITLDSYTGVGKVTRMLKLLNTQQYLEMRREAFANDGLTSTSPEYSEAYDINGTWDENKYTDWQKEAVGGTAKTSNIRFGISGGSQTTKFLISGNLSKESSVFPGDYAYKKGGAHFNMNHTSTDGKISVNFSGNYVVGNNDQPGEDLSYSIASLPPNHPALYKENGELNWTNVFKNPYAALESNYLVMDNTLTTATTLAYKVFSELEFKTTLGFTNTKVVESRTSPHTKNNPALGRYTPAFSFYQLNNSEQKSWNIEPQLSWKHQLGKVVLSALVGTTFQSTSNSQLYNTGFGFTSNSLIRNFSSATRITVSSNNSEYRYNALFGRINYAYAEKYILNLTARRDGSSRFGPGNRFGNFGAIGAAWLFGDEYVIKKSLPFLSLGKLRASFGTTGNDQIGDYQFLDTYSSSYANYNGISGLQPTRLYNPDFSWETNKKLEVALELGFLKDRVLFSAAYYRNRSSSQLVGIPLPGTTGFESIQANLNATVQNTGLELDLRTFNLKSKRVLWTTSFNISIPRNKLISFPNLEASTYSDYIIGKSLTIRSIYSYMGIDPQTGIARYKDYNQDGQISYENDKKQLIDLSQDFFGGITNHFVYKNFELDFLFQFVKQRGLSFMGTWSGEPAGFMGNQPVQVLDRWQHSGDIKPIQRYTTTYGDAYNASWRLSGSDVGFSDASFIRMKNISLAYNIEKLWIKDANCSLYLQAQNLFTFTNYKGTDPETQITYRLAPLRMITAGIKLNF